MHALEPPYSSPSTEGFRRIARCLTAKAIPAQKTRPLSVTRRRFPIVSRNSASRVSTSLLPLSSTPTRKPAPGLVPYCVPATSPNKYPKYAIGFPFGLDPVWRTQGQAHNKHDSNNRLIGWLDDDRPNCLSTGCP